MLKRFLFSAALLIASAVYFAQAEDRAVAPPTTVELPKADAEGWVSLFNGKDLAGWNGDPQVWRVERDYISGKAEKIPQNTFLIYGHPFRNFVLEAKVMLIKGRDFTNSGIQYRSKVTDPAHWVVHGYQADIGEGWWGTLYVEGADKVLFKPTPEAAKAVKADDWNQYVIEASGPHLKHTLNGVVCGESDDSSAGEGIIALQYHKPGAGFEVRFKDIRIKPLPDQARK